MSKIKAAVVFLSDFSKQNLFQFSYIFKIVIDLNDLPKSINFAYFSIPVLPPILLIGYIT